MIGDLGEGYGKGQLVVLKSVGFLYSWAGSMRASILPDIMLLPC